MNNFKFQGRQGDCLMTKVDEIPESAILQSPVNGDHIIAHSETGHNHVMAAETVDLYQSANDELVAFIHVKKPTEIRHLRGFDTHAPIKVNPGKYQIRRQREYTPEGYRRAAD